LASGSGPKHPDGLPEGYIGVPFLDLGGSIYALIRGDLPADIVVIKRSSLERPGVGLNDLIAMRADESVPPAIRAGDLLIVDRERVAATTAFERHPKSWPINIIDASFYLVALGTRVVVRQLAWESARKPGVQPTILVKGTPQSKPRKIHPEKMPATNRMPADFDIIGRVVWRGGPTD